MGRILDNGDRTSGAIDKLKRVGDIVQYYEPGHVRPTLLQALKEAGTDEAEEVAKVCLTPALRAEQKGLLRGTRLTAQDAAAVALYKL